MPSRVNYIRITIAMLVFLVIANGMIESASQTNDQAIAESKDDNILHLNANTTRTVISTRTLETFTYTKTTSATDPKFSSDPVGYLEANSLITILVVVLLIMIVLQFRWARSKKR